MPQDFVDSRESVTSIFTAFPPRLIVNTPHALPTQCHTLLRSPTACANVRPHYRPRGRKHFSVSVASRADKLFLLVSALCAAHDSQFKESTLKRSACLPRSGSVGRDEQAACRELLLRMLRLCAAVCCRSASVHVCTSRATTPQQGNGEGGGGSAGNNL